jgi:hypothetical protein
METRMAAVELTGTIDKDQRLTLDQPMPVNGPVRVKIILLYPLTETVEDMDEAEWLYAVAHNPAFADLREEAEDVYSPTDGRPFHDQE